MFQSEHRAVLPPLTMLVRIFHPIAHGRWNWRFSASSPAIRSINSRSSHSYPDLLHKSPCKLQSPVSLSFRKIYELFSSSTISSSVYTIGLRCHAGCGCSGWGRCCSRCSSRFGSGKSDLLMRRTEVFLRYLPACSRMSAMRNRCHWFEKLDVEVFGSRLLVRKPDPVLTSCWLIQVSLFFASSRACEYH